MIDTYKMKIERTPRGRHGAAALGHAVVLVHPAISMHFLVLVSTCLSISSKKRKSTLRVKNVWTESYDTNLVCGNDAKRNAECS